MSWQLAALNMVLRLTVKRRIARTPGPEEAARDMERAAHLFFRQPPYLVHIERPGRLHWISVGPCVRGKVILYLHGGGYVAGSPATHQGMLGRLSALSGVEICAPDYRLAQEAPFPAAFDDAVAAFSRLLALGYDPSDIILGGDSAGGGLCLALLSHCCEAGMPPAAAFVFSPWTDLALTGPSLRENRASDPLLPVERIEELVGIYLGTADRLDPRASPLYADFPGCPPVLIHVGLGEILRDDSLRMAERLRGFDASVTVETLPDAPHVWHIFDGWIPEARQSLIQAGRFVQTSFPDISR